MKRRDFLGLGAMSAIQLFALSGRGGWSREAYAQNPEFGFGPLQPLGELHLPAGFKAVAVQRGGDIMTDGYPMPPQPDGMAVFSGENGQYVLMRNHELGSTAFMEKYGLPMPNFGQGGTEVPRFSTSCFGGVCRVVLDRDTLLGELEGEGNTASGSIRDSRYILAGTDKNCSGGTMLGGWVTCEESSDPGHGYSLFTKPTDTKMMPPRPIRSWGRMHREGVVLDPETGVVYMTEDRADACFYRHVPSRPSQPMASGKVQAMVVEGHKTMDPYPDTNMNVVAEGNWKPGTEFKVTWKDIPDPQAVQEPCRVQGQALGCTTFNRNEGIIWDKESVWFISSLGGPTKGGQIFQYIPDRKDDSKGTLVLQLEVSDRRVLSCPDNLVMSPWGDVLLAEDNYQLAEGVRYQHVRGLTPDGKIYDLVKNPQEVPAEATRPGAEFTGLCFSPDNKVLFVNVQSPINTTFAIQGPWPKRA